MKLLLLALLSLSCASGSTTHIEGTSDAARRAEVRIENNNWAEAKVYLLPGSSMAGKRRIASVGANMRKTAFLRLISPTFRFYVTLLSGERWRSKEWNDQQATCFEVIIHNRLPNSYVIPCRRRR